MEFVVNAAIFEKIVQGHPEIDVGNIFVPDEVDPEKSVTDTDEDTGILYLRIVMGKPIGKVRSFSPGFRKWRIFAGVVEGFTLRIPLLRKRR